MQTGIFHRSRKPIRLTNGPLSYSGARPSRDGKQIFAIGTKQRGELVRYDMKSHQFVPFLSGISAIDPTFSRDGQWVAYTSYPDHTLWRSRSDGTERMQLTYPPMEVCVPFHFAGRNESCLHDLSAVKHMWSAWKAGSRRGLSRRIRRWRPGPLTETVLVMTLLE